MPVDAAIKAQWLADLRSGQYEQAHGALSKDGKFCCLGVLCEQAVKAGVITKAAPDLIGNVAYGRTKDVLSSEVFYWAGLPDSNPWVTVNGRAVPLAGLNDGMEFEDGNAWQPRTFAEIADVIEAQL